VKSQYSQIYSLFQRQKGVKRMKKGSKITIFSNLLSFFEGKKRETDEKG